MSDEWTEEDIFENALGDFFDNSWLKDILEELLDLRSKGHDVRTELRNVEVMLDECKADLHD